MEMINYVPKNVDADLNAINRTVNRQREAMLQKAQKTKGGAEETKQTPEHFGDQNQQAAAASEPFQNPRKRRRDPLHVDRKSSKERKKDKKHKKHRRRRENSVEEDGGGSQANSNALEEFAKPAQGGGKKKGEDTDIGNLGEGRF